MHMQDDNVTLDELRAIHPGAPGPGDSNAWIAALDEGWKATTILTHARLYAQLIRTQHAAAQTVENWLRSLGTPPRPLEPISS